MKRDFKFTFVQIVCITLMMVNWILWQYFYSIITFYVIQLILWTANVYIAGFFCGRWKREGG